MFLRGIRVLYRTSEWLDCKAWRCVPVNVCGVTSQEALRN